MSILFSICVGITIGSMIGLINGVIRNYFNHDKQRAASKKTFFHEKIKSITPIINILTFALLIIGLTWTVYYLVLGIIDTSQTEYATNVSQLIVSVLTVFSIIIAFYQFLKGK